MVFINVFVDMDAGISVGLMAIGLWWLLFHLMARPYRVRWVNTLQTVAGMCLLLLTILNSSTGAFASIGFDPAGTPLEQLQDATEWMMLVLLFIPALTWFAFTAQNLMGMNSDAGAAEEGEGDMEIQIQRADQQIATLTTSNARLHSETTQLQAENTQLQAENTQFHAKTTQLQAQIERLQMQLSVVRSDSEDNAAGGLMAVSK